MDKWLDVVYFPSLLSWRAMSRVAEVLSMDGDRLPRATASTLRRKLRRCFRSSRRLRLGAAVTEPESRGRPPVAGSVPFPSLTGYGPQDKWKGVSS